MAYVLWKSKTGFRNTDNVIHKLIRGAVQTGIFATIFAAGDLISFGKSWKWLFKSRKVRKSICASVTNPETNIYGMFAIPLGRIYTNVSPSLSFRLIFSEFQVDRPWCTPLICERTWRSNSRTLLSWIQWVLWICEVTRPKYTHPEFQSRNNRSTGIQIKVQGHVTTRFDAVTSEPESIKRDWAWSGVCNFERLDVHEHLTSSSHLIFQWCSNKTIFFPSAPFISCRIGSLIIDYQWLLDFIVSTRENATPGSTQQIELPWEGTII